MNGRGMHAMAKSRPQSVRGSRKKSAEPVESRDGSAHPAIESDDPKRPQLTRLQRVVVSGLLGAFWSAFALTILSSSMIESAVRPSYLQRVFLQVLSPQGWAFFTRDARESWYRAFLIDSHGQPVPANVADYRGAPWNGVHRNVRNRGIAIGQVLKGIPKESWSRCEKPITTCFRGIADEQPAQVSLTMRDHTGFCGPALLQEKTTVPWAWRRSYTEINMPSRIAYVDVNCVRPSERG